MMNDEIRSVFDHFALIGIPHFSFLIPEKLEKMEEWWSEALSDSDTSTLRYANTRLDGK